MASFFTVSSTQAVQVYAAGDAPATVYNLGNGALHYKTTSNVSTSDSSIASAGKKTFYSSQWVISAGTSKLMIENGVADAINSAEQPSLIRTWQPVAATSGTDTACTSDTAYVGSIVVPKTFLATGVSYLIGSVGGTDKVVTSLHNSNGELVANSATAGTTVGTAANVQSVAFTATKVIPPGRYFVGVCFNGTTAKFRTIPAHTLGPVGNSVTQTFGTPANFTAPTSFTADKVPVAGLY